MTAPSTAISSACARSSGRSIPTSMRSKPSMASAIDTANPEQGVRHKRGGPARDTPIAQARAHRRGGWILGSRLGSTIVLLNLLGLGILVGGALILNEM